MRRRQLTATLQVVLITICALGGPLLYVSIRSVSHDVQSDMLREAETVSPPIEDRIREKELDTASLARLAPRNRRVIVVMSDGRVLMVGPPPGDHPYAARLQLSTGGSLLVERSRADVFPRQVGVVVPVIALSLLAAAIAVALAVRSARRLSGPLLQLAADAARLGAGDFRPAGRRYGVPELDGVAEVLDATGLRLAELVRRERELVGDISHQLRSRLTALSMRLEEVAVNSSDPDSRAEAGAALEQSDRLSGVIDELLAQARQDRLRAAVPVDMGTELMSVRIEWEPALRSAGRTLQLSTPEETHALATPGRLHQAIGVLVDNALRHGGGPVRLAVRTTEQYVVVEVTDDGPGVPPELVGRLFERGVSGSRGTGLGLALARALIEADGGRLELRRARPATFAIYLLRPAPDRFGTEPGPDPSAAGTSGAAAGGPADEASSSSAGSGSAASLPSARKTQRL